MVDINKQDLAVGDYVLVALSSCGYIKMEYATITRIIDDCTVKLRFETSLTSTCKTKTVNYYTSQMLKVNRDV